MARRSEVFDLPPQEPSGPAHGTAPRVSRTARGPLPWVGLAIVLVLTGVALAEPVPSPWRIGVVDQLGEPAEVWTTPHGMAVDANSSAWITDEAILVRSRTAVSGFDRTTGAKLWTVEAVEPRCQQSSHSSTVCLIGPLGDGEAIYLDALAGETSREPVPDVMAMAVYGEDSVVVRREGTGAVLERAGPDGEVLWSVGLRFDLAPGGYDVPDHQLWGSDLADVSMELTDAQVLVGTIVAPGSPISWIHDLDAGRPEELKEAGLFLPWSEDLWFVSTPAGWYLLHRDGRLSEPRSHTSVMVFDDDPESRVTFRTDTGFEVVAESGGHEIWTHPGSLIGRAGGVVVLRHEQVVLGVSERTGQERWRQDPHVVSSRPIVTDGQTLAVNVREWNAMVALDLRSGEITTSGHQGARGAYYGSATRGTTAALLFGTDLVLWDLAP